MYEIRGLIKFAEEDIYNEGCQPDTTQHHEIPLNYKADTLAGLLKKVMQDFSLEVDDLQLNACEELGRLDFSRMEDVNSTKANKYQLEQWREGLTKLWNANYTARVEKVEREAINLEVLNHD